MKNSIRPITNAIQSHRASIAALSIAAQLAGCAAAVDDRGDEPVQDTTAALTDADYVNCPAVEVSHPSLPYCATATIKLATQRLPLASVEAQYVPNYLTLGAVAYDVQTPQGTPPFSLQYQVRLYCASPLTPLVPIADSGWRDIGNSPLDGLWTGTMACALGTGTAAKLQIRYDRTHGRLIDCQSLRIKGLCNSGVPW